MQNRTKVRRRVLACARCRKRKLSVHASSTHVIHVLTSPSAMARFLPALVVWTQASSVLASTLQLNKKLRDPLQISWKRTLFGSRAKPALHQHCDRWDNRVLLYHLQQIPTHLTPDRVSGVQRNVPSQTALSTRSWKTSHLHSWVSARPGHFCSASSKAPGYPRRRDLFSPMI